MAEPQIKREEEDHGNSSEEPSSSEVQSAPPSDVVELCKETFQKTAEYLRGELDGKFRMATGTQSMSDRDFTERLIEEVKKHPVLYNPREPGYKDRFKVEAEWKAVASCAGCTGTIEDYKLLEKMNKLTMTKYSEMKNVALSIGDTLKELNDKYKSLQPYLEQIDEIEEGVESLEKVAYSLDQYSKRLGQHGLCPDMESDGDSDVNQHDVYSAARLFAPHYPEKYENPKHKPDCKVCKAINVRTQTRFYCQPCGMALCIHPCFGIYHTKENIAAARQQCDPSTTGRKRKRVGTRNKDMFIIEAKFKALERR